MNEPIITRWCFVAPSVTASHSSHTNMATNHPTSTTDSSAPLRPFHVDSTHLKHWIRRRRSCHFLFIGFLLSTYLLAVLSEQICVLPPGSAASSISSSIPCGLTASQTTCCDTIENAFMTLQTRPILPPANDSISWDSAFTSTQRSQLLTSSVHSIRLGPGTYGCSSSSGGWLVTTPVHIIGSIDLAGLPTSIIDCHSSGRIFDVLDSSLWLTNLILQNGASELGSALRVNVGLNLTTGAVPDSGISYTNGTDRTLFPPFGLIYDLLNVQVLNHQTLGPGALALRFNADSSDSASVIIRSCTFSNNHGTVGTNFTDGVHAGAITVVYNGLISQTYNYHLIEDTIFTDNAGGNDFGFGAAVGAGALALAYSGAIVSSANTFQCSSCTFLRNSGGSRIITDAQYGSVLNGFVIGAGAVVVGNGAKIATLNSETFTKCVFRDNVGGENCSSPIGEAAGAGAVSINYVPYSTCNMYANTQAFFDCEFTSNRGGNGNNNLVSNYASNQGLCIAGALAGGGAGAVSIIISADALLTDPSQVTQDLQNVNQNQSVGLWANSQIFERCTFQNNYGGIENNLYSTPCVGGGGGSGAIFIVYDTTAIHGVMENNTLIIADSSFTNNTGGDKNNGNKDVINGASAGGGAGGVFLFFLAAVISGSISGNTQLISNTAFLHNMGGNSNSYGNTAGGSSAGMAVFYAMTTSLATSSTSSYTTVLELSRNSLLVSDCEFSHNVGGSHNAETSNGGSAAGGLGVTFFSYSLSELVGNIIDISNTDFLSNQGAATQNSYGAMSGGLSFTTIVFTSTSRISNTNIRLDGCSFINNTATTTLQGLGSLSANTGGFGFVFPYPSVATTNDGNTVLIQDSIFDGHQSTSGAAIWMITTLVPFKVSIIDSTFERNIATGDGGAIRFSDVNCFIQDSSFALNSATSSGGALVTEGYTKVTLQRVTFDDNSANQFAGDLLVLPPSTVTLDNCTIQMASGNELLAQLPAIVFSNVQSSNETTTVSTLSYDNSTTFQCRPGNVVYQTPTSFGCQYCRTDSYSLSYSRWIKHAGVDTLEKINPLCSTCEFGASCKFGGSDVRSLVGYWGQTVTAAMAITDSSSTTALHFTLCLPTYCCTVEEASSDSICPAYNWCAPHRVGRLCGQCEPGYSEVLGSDECQANYHCTANRWFYIVALLAGAVLAVLIAIQGAVAIQQRNQDARESNKDSPHAASSRTPFVQSITLLIYFFQLAGQMYISGTNTSTQSFLAGLFSALRNLFEFSPSSGSNSGGVCLWPDMTSVQKQSMYLTGPFFILVPFLIIFFFLFQFAPRSRRLIEMGATPMYLWSVLLVGLVKILLFGFSTFVRRLLILVHCVHVLPEEGTFLLQNGEIECFQPFQIGAVICLGLMACYPFLFIYWLRPREYHLQAHQTGGTRMQRRQSLLDPNLSNWRIARLNLVDLLTEAYHPRYRYWEGALLIYRLAVAAFSTLITQSLVQYIVLFGINLVMLNLHIQLQPFRFSVVQMVQTVCLMFLTIISACSLPIALMVSIAQNPPAGALGPDILAWVQFLSLTLCAFVCLGVLIWYRQQQIAPSAAPGPGMDASKKAFDSVGDHHANGNGRASSPTKQLSSSPTSSNVADNTAAAGLASPASPTSPVPEFTPLLVEAPRAPIGPNGVKRHPRTFRIFQAAGPPSSPDKMTSTAGSPCQQCQEVHQREGHATCTTSGPMKSPAPLFTLKKTSPAVPRPISGSVEMSPLSPQPPSSTNLQSSHLTSTSASL